jgi:putative transposase
MTSPQQRTHLIDLITQACTAGARRHKACRIAGISSRTLQRWTHPQALQLDQRITGQRSSITPPNSLSLIEQDHAVAVMNSEEFKDLPPSQIVPRLADQGRYIGSESTLYRLLHKRRQMGHRRLARMPRKIKKPRALVATKPDQIYSWDITYLPSQVKGQYFYLYLYLDIFSRKIVGWQVFDGESAQLASGLLTDICERQKIRPNQLTVHSDNGGPMKGETMLATMQRLGVAPSRSRPSVSNDNPYSESIFNTLKHRPQLPVRSFLDVIEARSWAVKLVTWYNEEHRHSSISFVTPSQRHAGEDIELLHQREALFEAAKQAHPKRWSGSTRNWKRKLEVHLNPNSTQNKEQKTLKKTA